MKKTNSAFTLVELITSFVILMCVCVLIIIGMITIKKNRTEKKAMGGCLAKTEIVVDQTGWEIGIKVTFENHTYIKSYQVPYVHLESCPCHTNVIIIEKQ